MFKAIKSFFQRKKNTSTNEDPGLVSSPIDSQKSIDAEAPQTATNNPQRTVLVFDTKKRIFVVKKRIARVALYNPASHKIIFKSPQGVEKAVQIPLDKEQIAPPLSGFWFDKEECNIGLYVPGLEKFYLLKEQHLKNISIDAKQFVGVGDYERMLPISGFLFDSEIETIGLYDPSSALFLLKHNDETKHKGTVFQYGPLKNHMQPLIGDWYGDGKDSVGLYDSDSGVFFLKGGIEENSKEDINFHFGPSKSDMQALSGDWNATGNDKVALYSAKDGLFFLKPTNQGAEHEDLHCYFGPKGKHICPLVGDWSGEGLDGLGVYDSQVGIAYLKNNCISGDADTIIQFSEFEQGSVPVVVYDLV